MDVRQIFLIVMFALAIACILKEPTIRLGKRKLKIDYGTAPFLSVLVLAIFGYVNGEILLQSLSGVNGVVPWQVIAIFFAGAYICISIDSSGVLEYTSFRIIRMSGGDAKKLYFGIVGLTALLTIFTSNDIVILTMTPIICYMAKHSKINPIPYLLAVFFAANAWSMLFYVGNPPNIIVAQVFNLGFLEYAKYMLAPTVAAGVSTTLIVYLIFRKELTGKVSLHSHVKPADYLRNRWAALINVLVFAAFFVMLSTAEYIGIEVWMVVLAFFGIYLLLNIFFSFYYKETHFSSNRYHYEKTMDSMRARNLGFNITEFRMSFERVPWKMLPLIASLFVLIHLFTVYGITDHLARFLNNFDSLFSCAIATSFVSAASANVMINQPTTILFANAFQNPGYLVEGTAKLTSGLALVVGTNLGGNLTLFGALAGLMWKKILSFHDIEMSYGKFLIQSLKVTPLVILIAALVLLLQMMFLF
ncbi:MAG: arsenic transporter [Thermoplasmata archaeon HGW-Thermoplasmata-1]|nr:MAG: arsenic transporter [Thermoplasmata archaeon HGW-Thermoplasmata-1]